MSIFSQPFPRALAGRFAPRAVTRAGTGPAVGAIAQEANAAASAAQQSAGAVESVFGAEVISRQDMPDGRVGQAELKFGNSMLQLSDQMPHIGVG